MSYYSKLDSFILVGDSQLLRYYHYLGRYYTSRNPALCFSGATINELRDKLIEVNYFSDRLILLIGTNDLLRFRSLEDLKRDYSMLVKDLHRKIGCEGRLILVTVPAIPRLQKNPDFWVRLHWLNSVIRSFDHWSKIDVIDVKTYERNKLLRPVYYGERVQNPPEFFEQSYRNGRSDLIDINRWYFRDLYHLLRKTLDKIRLEELD